MGEQKLDEPGKTVGLFFFTLEFLKLLSILAFLVFKKVNNLKYPVEIESLLDIKTRFKVNLVKLTNTSIIY